MRLRYTRAARQDMRAIYRQSEEMFGLNQADSYAAGLTWAFKVIADFPLAARLRMDNVPAVRVQPYRSHVIIYAISDSAIEVLRVRHASEDWINDPVGTFIEDDQQ